MIKTSIKRSGLGRKAAGGDPSGARDSGGNSGSRPVTEDIAKQKRAEEALREAELRYRTLADSGQALIWTATPDKKCDYFNLPWLKLTGRTLEQELGDGWAEGVHPDDIERCIKLYTEAFDRRERFSIDYRLRRYDGEYRWIQDDGTPRYDSRGKFLGYIGHCLDITDRKRAEEKTRELLAAVQSEKRILSTLIDSISDEIWFTDAQGRFSLANPAALKEFALDPDRPVDVETLAKSLEVFRPDGSPRPVDEAPPLRALAGEEVRNQEEMVRTPAHSEIRYRQVSAAPVRDPSGRIIGAVSIVRDITELKKAAENMRSLSLRQEAILAAVPDIIMEVDVEKVYTWANRAGLEFFGEDVIGKEAADYFIGEQETYAIVKPLFSGREDVFYVESWQRRRDGEKRLLAWWCRALKDAEGKVTGALSTARDITERQRAEARLQESRALYESIFEATGTATLLVEQDTTIVMANRECLAVTGYGPEELVGTKWPNYVAPQSLEIMLNYHKLRREEPVKAPDKYEVRMVNKRGQIRDVAMAIAVIPGTNRSVVSLLDITERKRAEEVRIKGEKRFRELAEMLPQIIFETDQKGNLTFTNKTGLKSFGYSLADLESGINIVATIAPQEREAVKGRFVEILNGAETTAREFQAMKKGGEIFPILMHANAILEDGVPIGVRGIAIDITESKRAVQTLREREQRLSNIYDTVGDVIYHLAVEPGGQYRFVSINHAFSKVTGMKPEQVVGKRVSEIIPEPSLTMALANYRRAIATKSIVMWEETSDYPTGQLIGEVSVAPVFDDQGRCTHLVGSVHDVTERTRAEEALKASEEKFRMITEQTLDLISVTDADGVIVYASPASEALFQFTPEEMCGHRFMEFLAEPDIPEAMAAFRDAQARDERTKDLELTMKRKDGSTFVGELNGSIFRYGRQSGTLVVIRDITERKRADEAIAASLREKDILLREIHHRVKNNMQVISSLLSLQAGHVADGEARRVLKEGQLRIRSMALIHEKLYQARDLSRIEFASYIRSLAAYLFEFFKVDPGQVRLETEVGDVRLDINTAVPCGLLISELISNALKHAFPKGRKGTVSIRLRREKDGAVKIKVADDGVGFPESMDFRRTESFGLQIVDLLIGQLEGTIELDRKKGTAFTVSFRDLEYKPRT